jgi:release factor glutamine methyltransferase
MAVKIRTIKDIRIYLTRELKDVYQDPEIRVLSDILIRTVTGIKKLHQLYDSEFPVNDQDAGKIVEYTAELKRGKPVQYVLGETVFYNCIIRLNGSTLIPRPETEELVDLIIKENTGFTGNIVDFGSGSGCIAIALAANMPGAAVTGLEISGDAITIAGENAVLNNVKVSFIKDDILDPSAKELGTAGIIVSNPPYVRDSEKVLMARNVLDFEPHLALFVTDSDPLVYYKAIVKAAENILLPDGRIYFEINENMGGPMAGLLESYGYSDIKVISDINGKSRIIKGIRNVR